MKCCVVVLYVSARKGPSALNITSPAPAQLTIFYAGSVSVFDAITAEKVGSFLSLNNVSIKQFASNYHLRT